MDLHLIWIGARDTCMFKIGVFHVSKIFLRSEFLKRKIDRLDRLLDTDVATAQKICKKNSIQICQQQKQISSYLVHIGSRFYGLSTFVMLKMSP